MTRRLPFPLLSLSLLFMWLILNQTLAPGHVLLGGLLGWAGARAFVRLQPASKSRGGAAWRRARMAVELSWLVLADIVRSNVAVARISLQPGVRGRTAGFLTMPLELHNPAALALLACVITATPGTSWARYDAERHLLTIHVLDLVDEQAWMRQFKERYEWRLLEIFP